MTTNLEVTKRSSNADATRKAGQLPAVVYGPKQEPLSISVDKFTFERTLEESGESTIINLTGLEGDAIEVLIHDVAFNPAKGGVEHVDFYAIERGKELTVDVALEFIGESPTENKGFTVNKALHEVEVTCKPRDLPSHIDVDISTLVDEESAIYVKDLVIPSGVTVETEPDILVVSLTAAREEELEEEPEAPDMDSIEVEHKGKDDEGSEDGKEENTEEKE